MFTAQILAESAIMSRSDEGGIYNYRAKDNNNNNNNNILKKSD